MVRTHGVRDGRRGERRRAWQHLAVSVSRSKIRRGDFPFRVRGARRHNRLYLDDGGNSDRPPHEAFAARRIQIHRPEVADHRMARHGGSRADNRILQRNRRMDRQISRLLRQTAFRSVPVPGNGGGVESALLGLHRRRFAPAPCVQRGLRILHRGARAAGSPPRHRKIEQDRDAAASRSLRRRCRDVAVPAGSRGRAGLLPETRLFEIFVSGRSARCFFRFPSQWASW